MSDSLTSKLASLQRCVESALLSASHDGQERGGRTLGLLVGEFTVPDDLSTESEEINGMFYSGEG